MSGLQSVIYFIMYHIVTNCTRLMDPTDAPGTEIIDACRYTPFVTSTLPCAFVVYVRHIYLCYFLVHTVLTGDCIGDASVL